jgi:general secretion pathway protein G
MEHSIRTGRLDLNARREEKPVKAQRQIGDQNNRLRRFGRGAAGFTLIELMIVITIIMILVGIASVHYERSVQRAREATLKSDLQVMRVAIENYTLDKQAAPQSLQDLVDAKYLREVPVDPMTHQQDWQLKIGDTVMSPDQTTVGVEDVHSNSDQTSQVEGTPYNTW